MKLNKVLALALSGVMAVSMLAGCSTDGKDDGNTEVTPPTSNAVSVMNDAQSLVKFEANADLDAALAAAAKKAKHKTVSGAPLTLTTSQNDSDAVYKELVKKLPVGEVGGNVVFNSDSADAGKTLTKTALYMVEADGLTEKAALEQIATLMKANKSYYPELVVKNSTDYHKASYTGSVSVVTVTTADGGNTATAYYIAVSVTQSVARDASTKV